MTRLVLKRPGLALVTGAVTGGILAAAWFTVLYAVSYPVEGGTFVPNGADIARWAVACFIAATITFGVGMLLVGAPVWMYLDHRGVRGPVAAACLGPGLILSLSALSDLITRHRVALDLGDGLLAGACVIVGLVVQRVAYIKADDITPPPAPRV